MGKSNRMLCRLVCVVLTLGAFPALAQTQRCEELNHLTLPGIAIRSATPVPAGMFGPPGVAARAVPGLCRVVATVLPELGFEVWLPEKWNRKYIGVGNGGLAGNIVYSAMFNPVERGYAVSSTDTTRPMMFSALKSLDPLDDQGEHGEHRDRQDDEGHVGHLGHLRVIDGARSRIPAARTGPHPGRVIHGTAELTGFLGHSQSSNGPGSNLHAW